MGKLGTGNTFLLVVQSLSVWLFATPWTAACQASLSFTISRSLLKFMSIQSMMPSNHLILCCPLLLMPSIFPSIGVFSNELTLHIRWPKYWSFSFSIIPSNEYSGLISFRIDWFDLLLSKGLSRVFYGYKVQRAKGEEVIYVLWESLKEWGEERDNGPEIAFEKIMAENSEKLMKEIKKQI